jgi:tetratricopeptide (TPR) repeat protein
VLVACGLVIAGAIAGPAHAQVRSDGGGAEGEARAVRSEFWREVAEPRYRRSRTLLRHAVTLLRRYAETPSSDQPAQRRALLEAAIHRLELARAITPDDPEILYRLATAKASWVQPIAGGGERRIDDEAIEIFDRLRAVDSDFMPEDVAFSLGVLHTRAHRFDDAAREYERAMAQELMVDTSYIALGNLAEVTMLAGDVARAARFYERAVDMARRAGDSSSLPLWGLAVALDRLGEHRAALDRTRDALAASQGTTSELHRPGVFFEPPYELHWYEALASEALSEMEANPAERRQHIEASARQWEQFLSQSAGESRWEDIARRNLDAVRQQLGR